MTQSWWQMREKILLLLKHFNENVRSETQLKFAQIYQLKALGLTLSPSQLHTCKLMLHISGRFEGRSP